MNSKGHLFISLAKSVLRIISSILSIRALSIIPMAVGFLGAEILGVAEELVDKR